MSAQVRIVEVSPRDGLQSEPATVPTEVKHELIRRLIACGLKDIEVTAFVRPERLPQLADAEQLAAQLAPAEGVRFSALVPNLQGVARAQRSGVNHLAFFTAASETFCEKNIGCSIEQSLQRYRHLSTHFQAQRSGLFRVYISCAFGCPYEGVVNTDAVVRLANRLMAGGCNEIVLADTIGVATPDRVRRLVKDVARHLPVEQIALHLHDTRGQALASVYACLDLGIGAVDASVAGLGGCPYAPGATGNLATEDLVYMLEGCGVDTGIDLAQLIAVGRFISNQLERVNQSRVGVAEGSTA